MGNTAGVFVPYLAAAFITDPYERAQWTPFWMTTAAIMGCSGLIFLICGETSRQDLTKDKPAGLDDDEDDDDHHHEACQCDEPREEEQDKSQACCCADANQTKKVELARQEAQVAVWPRKASQPAKSC